MGVSKVAVMALVAILAVPILMGYAMNLNETSVTYYEKNNDPVNVTQLLQTGTDWSIADGNIYQMNSNLYSKFTQSNIYPQIPRYNKITQLTTSIPLRGIYVPNWVGGTEVNIRFYNMYETTLDYTISAGHYVNVQLFDSDYTSLTTLNYITYLHYDRTEGSVYYMGYTSEYDTQPVGNELPIADLGYATYTLYGFSTVPLYYSYFNSASTYHADLSEGYYFYKYSGQPALGWDLVLPDNSVNALLSIDLDSITDSTYTMTINNRFILSKTTVNGTPNWKVTKIGSSEVSNLYYNPRIAHNTYQVFIEDLRTPDEPVGSYTTHYGRVTFKFVGNWQTLIGAANYYNTYSFDFDETLYLDAALMDQINITTTGNRTPTLRIDAAQYRAFQFPVIEGTYDPAGFKTNPSTTITDVTNYGQQFIFGGNTYTVTKGNIYLEGHKTPVNGIVFDSVFNPVTSQYDNRINGTIVSSTPTPSTIQFVGKWSANVSTISMSQSTYNKTSWTPGQYAWDGLDSNFLMIGLITAIGTFIALGIYARRARIALWPAFLVCAGAAALFFTML